MLIKQLLKITLLSSLFSMRYTSTGLREIYNPNALEIGIYSGAGYNFCKDLKEDSQPDRELPISALPANLNAVLPQVITKRVSFVLLGLLENHDDGTTYNVCFHRVLREWRRGSVGFDEHNVEANLQMGIFNGYAVSALGGNEAITFDRLAVQNVNLHPGAVFGGMSVDAYSPNNARFTVDDSKPFSSFWTVALSEDHRNAYIAFVVLVHNQEIEEKIKEELKKTNNDIEQALRAVDYTTFSQDEKTAFEGIIAVASNLTEAVQQEERPANAGAAAAAESEKKEEHALFSLETPSEQAAETPSQQAARLASISSALKAFEGKSQRAEHEETSSDFLLATQLQEEEDKSGLAAAAAASAPIKVTPKRAAEKTRPLTAKEIREANARAAHAKTRLQEEEERKLGLAAAAAASAPIKVTPKRADEKTRPLTAKEIREANARAAHAKKS